MTTHELPEEPVYAFVPSYDLPDQPQQNRRAGRPPQPPMPCASTTRTGTAASPARRHAATASRRCRVAIPPMLLCMTATATAWSANRPPSFSPQPHPPHRRWPRRGRAAEKPQIDEEQPRGQAGRHRTGRHRHLPQQVHRDRAGRDPRAPAPPPPPTRLCHDHAATGCRRPAPAAAPPVPDWREPAMHSGPLATASRPPPRPMPHGVPSATRPR